MRALILILFVFPFALISQHYRCVQPGSVHYFANSDGEVQGYDLDTFTLEGTDTVYYFHHSMGEDSFRTECPSRFYVDHFSWLGSKCVVRPNGDNLFFNIKRDTLLIKSGAGLNETWRFGNYDDTSYIQARVTGISYEKVLDVQDSIKTISFDRYDNNGTLLNTSIDKPLRLSKSFGLVTINKLLVVKSDLSYFDFERIPYRVVSMADIYDFEEDDEFQYLIPGRSGAAVYGIRNVRVMAKYARGSYWLRTVLYEVNMQDNKVTLLSIADNTVNYSPFEILNSSLPDEVLDYTGQALALAKPYRYEDSTFIVGPGFRCAARENDDSTCWRRCWEEGNFEGYTYREGFGDINNIQTTGNGGFWYYEEYMVYAKKSGKTAWGSKYLGTDQHPITGSYTVYPNPAKNKVSVSTGSDKLVSVAVSDMYGKQVLVSSESEISLGFISPGIYILSIQSDKGSCTRRLLVE